MIDIKDRVRCAALHSKIVSAEVAAAVIKPGMNIGTSGFTPSGYPKAVPLALAERIKKEHFQINLWTGASVGKELDGALAAVQHREVVAVNIRVVTQLLTGNVAGRRFQLDNISPHPCQQLCASRTCLNVGHVENSYAFKSFAAHPESPKSYSHPVERLEAVYYFI